MLKTSIHGSTGAEHDMLIKIALDKIYPVDIIGSMTPEELKQWRAKTGYTQTALAKALGVGQVCIARWETGVRKIPSFLHLALDALEYKAEEVSLIKGKKNKLNRRH